MTGLSVISSDVVVTLSLCIRISMYDDTQTRLPAILRPVWLRLVIEAHAYAIM
jgi:hypothetical protein